MTAAAAASTKKSKKPVDSLKGASSSKTVKTAAKSITAKSQPKKAACAKKSDKTKSLSRNKTRNSRAGAISTSVSDALPERLESEIKQYLGLRYRRGGTGQDGFDCSGLVQRVYADVFDINLPRSSWEQSRLEKMESITDQKMETGDLLFFGPRRQHVNHVGIYLSGGYFLHAASSEGVTISRLDESYWKSRLMLTKRVRGLQIGYDNEIDQDADEGALTELALGTAFSGEGIDQVNYLEGGFKYNNWPEFRLTGFYSRAIDSLQAPDPGSSLPLQPIPYYLDDSISGFRLATVFAPLPWEGFRLIPSVTQTTTRNEKTALYQESQTLGLETWVTLPANRLAVFMGAHTQNREDLFARPLNIAPDWRSLDFSFGLRYRLSDALNLSLTGTQAYRASIEDDEMQEQPEWMLEDIAFRLNFRF